MMFSCGTVLVGMHRDILHGYLPGAPSFDSMPKDFHERVSFDGRGS